MEVCNFAPCLVSEYVATYRSALLADFLIHRTELREIESRYAWSLGLRFADGKVEVDFYGANASQSLAQSFG
jgi:hypothetical protein